MARLITARERPRSDDVDAFRGCERLSHFQEKQKEVSFDSSFSSSSSRRSHFFFFEWMNENITRIKMFARIIPAYN